MFEIVEEHLRKREWAEAEVECRSCIQQQPILARGHGLLGLILYRQARYEEAVPSLQRAVALDPNFHDAGALLAQTLDRLQRYKEALEVARETIKLRPNDLQLTLLIEGLSRQVDEKTDAWERSVNLDWHHVTLAQKE
ncbi:MAG TPA: tetratricopeptide repeat protein [Fimbriimonadaceae bacterium]|nr:tetratricopeptide repeat protein [Fimbriimonadaceae bacterium]